MNTNCTKCGNPLQAGTTICPVCGTNNINVAQAAAPAAPGVVPPAAPGVAPAVPDPAAAQVAAPGVAPAAPGVVPPVAPGVVPAVPDQAAAQPVAPAAPGVVPPAAPGVAPAVPTANQVVPPAPGEKKPVNKKMIIIIAVAAVALIAVGIVVFLIMNGGNSDGGSTSSEQQPSTPTPTPTPAAQPVAVNYRDFDFSLPGGWNFSDETGVLTLYSKDSDVIVLLESIPEGHYLPDLKADDIKTNLGNFSYKDVTVEETSVNNQNAFLAKATMDGDEYVYNFYYIYAQNDMIVVSIIYTNANNQPKYKKVIENFVNSIKYQNSEHALSDASLYAEHSSRAVSSVNNSSGSGQNVEPGTFEDF